MSNNVIKQRQLPGKRTPITVDDIPDSLSFLPTYAHPISLTEIRTTGNGLSGSYPIEDVELQTNNSVCEAFDFYGGYIPSAGIDWESYINKIEAVLGRPLTEDEIVIILAYLSATRTNYSYNIETKTGTSALGSTFGQGWLTDFSCVITPNKDPGLFEKDYSKIVSGTMTYPVEVETEGNIFTMAKKLPDNTDIVVDIALLLVSYFDTEGIELLPALVLSSNIYVKTGDTFIPIINPTDEEKQIIVDMYNTYLAAPDKLTPKTDFAYTNNTDNTVIYNINGTQKGTINVEFSLQNNYMSVGKGDYLYVDSNGYLKYFDKKGTFRNQIQIDPAASSYVISKKVATFLGKPFQAEGDNDRYVISSFFNTSTNLYDLILLNIDNWTYRQITVGSSQVMYDFTYDGDNLIYINKTSGNDVVKLTLNPLSYDNTAIIDALRIYGFNGRGTNNFSLSLKGTTGNFKVLNLTDGGIVEESGEAPNAVNLSNGTVLEPRIRSATEFNLYVRDDYNFDENGQFWDIYPSIENVLGAFYYVIPQLVLNFEKTETQITVSFVATITTSATTYMEIFTTTIDTVNETITSVRNGFINFEATIKQDILNNSFSNSCNSYGIGKFYNYGLQKQWDTNHETM